jgi:uncharacterized protein (TIGR02246 family)
MVDPLVAIRRAVALAFLIVSATAALAGPAEDASTVVDRWAAAFTANDAEAVVKLYASDAILLGTVSPQIADSTAAIRDYFSRLPESGNKVAIGEHRTRVLSDDAVLLTGFYEFGGQRGTTPARFSIVIVKRGNEWLIAHHHSSRRPEAPQ